MSSTSRGACAAAGLMHSSRWEARRAAAHLRDVHDTARVNDNFKNEIQYIMNWSQGEHEYSQQRSSEDESYWRWARAAGDLQRDVRPGVAVLVGSDGSVRPA
jgi:hypothetical protein